MKDLMIDLDTLIKEMDNGLHTLESLLAKIVELNREIRYLRTYGNKDCTAQAYDAMEEGTLE